MSNDMSQFLQTFFEESVEGLETMESGLLALAPGAADSDLVNDIFRAAHSIKGGSATFGLDQVAAFTHLMETLLDQWRDGRRAVDQEAIDLLLVAVDCLRDMLAAAQDGGEYDAGRVEDVKGRLAALLDMGETGAEADSEADEKSGAAAGWRIRFLPEEHLFRTGNDPVRILRELADAGDLSATPVTEKLPPLQSMDPLSAYMGWDLVLNGAVSRETVDEAFAWVEDDCQLTIEAIAADVPVAPTPAQEASEKTEETAESRSGTPERRKSSDSGSIRVGIDKVDAVINLVGELVITQSMLSTLGDELEQGFTTDCMIKLRDGLAQLERNTRELQEDVMRMRMLPIGFVFNRFPRLIHDLSTKLGKQVELRMSGEGTEVDKTLIEKITDPLVHLVRNAMDHGIETVDERRAAGKSESGTVSLNAYHKGGNIVIEVQDDGRGLDPERIRAKAVERGVIDSDTALTEEQVFELIFQPGFSTASEVSDLSGRGVGMDVVRRNIEALSGSVDIQSEPGTGSVFTVRLPLTLAILDGQSVAVGDATYIVPLISIAESIQVKSGMVNHVAGRGETFHWRGEYVRVIRLAGMFDVQQRAKELTEGLLVVVEAEGRHVGLFVDELQGQQQVVIKSLEANYGRIDGISGATILGDGSVALILDIPGIIRMSTRGDTTENLKAVG